MHTAPNALCFHADSNDDFKSLLQVSKTFSCVQKLVPSHEYDTPRQIRNVVLKMMSYRPEVQGDIYVHVLTALKLAAHKTTVVTYDYSC
jgi:hypothetical protein